MFADYTTAELTAFLEMNRRQMGNTGFQIEVAKEVLVRRTVDGWNKEIDAFENMIGTLPFGRTTGGFIQESEDNEKINPESSDI